MSALVSQAVMPVRVFPIPSGEVMSTLASQWAIEGTPKEAMGILSARSRAISRVPMERGRPEQIMDRLRAEFREMPDMRLTREQVQRLCGIEPPLCELALQTLVEAKFLRLGSDGAYVLFGP